MSLRNGKNTRDCLVISYIRQATSTFIVPMQRCQCPELAKHKNTAATGSGESIRMPP